MEVITQEQVANYKPIPAMGGMISSEKLAVRAELYHQELKENGGLGHLPFKSVKDEFEFLMGEVSVWAGETKSKKSFFTGFQMLHLALHKQKCAIASFEMPPEVTFERMSRAYNDKYEQTDGIQRMDLGERVQDHLYVYDFVGNVHVKDVYSYIHFCAAELDCKHILIDSLMMIQFKFAADINNDQKNFMSELIALAKGYKIHIHLVCHFKKPDNIKRRANVYDISGTAAIANIANNLFLIDRNTNPDIDIDIGLTLSRSRSFREWDDSIGMKFLNNFQFAHWKNSFPMTKGDMDRGCYF